MLIEEAIFIVDVTNVRKLSGYKQVFLTTACFVFLSWGQSFLLVPCDLSIIEKWREKKVFWQIVSLIFFYFRSVFPDADGRTEETSSMSVHRQHAREEADWYVGFISCVWMRCELHFCFSEGTLALYFHDCLWLTWDVRVFDVRCGTSDVCERRFLNMQQL